ncbi:hypothetical protein JCM14076_06590 [Methylosoma difficile]
MLKLIEVETGLFDLVFDVNASNDAQTAFTTFVYAVLFTDAEASSLQQPDRSQRRGWWFDPAAGSLIWWYRQQPLSQEVRRATIDNITTALLSHPALTDVVVLDISPAGSVSSLFVSIAATYNNLKSLVTVQL